MGNRIFSNANTYMYKNKNRILKKAAVTICAITLSVNICGNITSKAEDQSYINEAYRQLVTEKRDSATFTVTGDDKLHIDNIIAELVKIDEKDNLYDGPTLNNRGNWFLYRKGNEYTLKCENAFSIGEMEELTDEIAAEVKGLAGDGATDRELFYEYLKYMSEHCYYDSETEKNVTLMHDEKRPIKIDSITESYKKDGGLICTGYATITYIVANKLGIECRFIGAYKHVFNAVKFENSEKYIAYDLSTEKKYAGIGLITNTEIKLRSLFEGKGSKLITEACNEGISYRPASIGDNIRQFMYYHKETFR